MKWLLVPFVLTAVAVAVHRGATSSKRPATVLANERARLGDETCGDCHGDIVERFAGAPHGGTLRRGSDPLSLEVFAGNAATVAGQTIAFEQRGDELWATHSMLPFDRRVDWVFGSGHHAMTPVTIDRDVDGRPRLTQLRVSALGNGQLGQTPGTIAGKETPAQAASAATHAADPHGRWEQATFGRQSDPDDTRRCFGCHVSQLPERDDVVELERLTPSLDCSRCHPAAAAHAMSGGELPLRVRWHELTPLQSINRCGECHRRADEFTPGELTPDRTHLARFAPVGMAMSRCFQETQLEDRTSGQVRFDCVTCHDPHESARADPAHFNRSCIDCHVRGHSVDEFAVSESQADPVDCASDGIDASSNCIGCHMPSVEISPGLSFTDHWIRLPVE